MASTCGHRNPLSQGLTALASVYHWKSDFMLFAFCFTCDPKKAHGLQYISTITCKSAFGIRSIDFSLSLSSYT